MEQLERIIELFDAISEAPPAARPAMLDDACQGDEALRAELVALLQAHEQNDDFLADSPVIAAAAFDTDDHSARAIGRRIGAYRIRREIGHGGMGTVYLAVRDDDAYQKEVAIKLVWPGWNRDEMMRRFLRERRILARLEHPHIARLLDGGTTEEGWPYVVMEYVDGQPINEYCDAHNLPISVRLKLFSRVCEAVEYAHQQHVIHRDLKPGNLLVTADGTVKLLDFGIAKLIDPEIAPGRETQTRTGLRAMTPEYASPEQVRGETVTARSDVYSLGVLLYELLTGIRPYQINSRLLPEAVRIICETEPARPSTAAATRRRGNITTQEEEGSAASRKDTQGFGNVAASQLKGDLDNIILLALRKDAAQRYGSAAELRADIERHLNGEAVQARGASWFYRAGRFLRRHRVAAANVMLIGLLFGGGLFYLVRQTRLARAQAQQQRRARYAVALNQAWQDYQQNNLKQMNEKLLSFVPQPGEEELRGFEWFYLWRLGHREVVSLQHDNPVLKAEFSEDNRTMVTISTRPDNKTSDTTWDTETWQPVVPGPSSPIVVHRRPPADLTARQERPDTILIKDKTGRVVTTLSDPANGLSNAHWLDNNRMATGGRDNIVRIWNVRTGQLLSALPAVPESYDSAYLPLPEKLLVMYAQRMLRMWDLTTGRLIYTITDSFGISFYYWDNTLLVFNSALTDRLRLFDLSTGRLIKQFRGGTDGPFRSIAYSERLGLLATAGDDRTIRLWVTDTWREVAVLRGHTDWVLRAVFSPDDRLLASVSSDRTLRLWDVVKRRELAVIRHPDEVHGVTWSPDQKLLVTTSRDRNARVWRVADLLAPEVLRGHTSSIYDAAISADGQRIATAGNDRTVRLWHLQDGSATVLRGHEARVLAVAFAPDGSTLASGGEDGTVRLWNAQTGQMLKLINNGGTRFNGIRSLAFSPDGARLASAANDHEARIWDAASGELRQRFAGHQNEVLSVAFSPDGMRLVTSASDRTARVWDVATGRTLAVLTGHNEWVWSAKFSPDGKTIATGSMDQTVKLWDATTYQEITTLRGHTDEVFSVAFSPDGTRLATASNDKTVKLWNLATRQEVLTLHDHTEQVWAVAFSADGNTLVSGSWDGTARIYRAATYAEASAQLNQMNK